ncbi:hypothetical protein [Methylobacterium brachythecii]|uniref:2-polyprenyl-3-methyl-5-hydroxy-6-metoxy-1, 4-benzoquinol methylase n=1 Tax=Methylobacterium brachythecii TaxID=1176177 RepID=A0A7W6AMY4_9HYPH|nr:hypothetical protein [Methylobacterium brachythecii]MBB3905563.1 2-polyprenyl-3-methyl-5-hydroxy-6-metoxy-1,4-benzoquinol methylase [Methylobacterium brachythecii]GLS46550.1 hypothetical protein GCM10007884_45440 [Methylobacterium brachythecii]
MISKLEDSWWYYTVEKPDRSFFKGVYNDDMILLPRKNLSKIDLKGRKVADICTMEGLIPTIMCKSGASTVVAADSARPSVLKDPGVDTIEMNLRKIDYIKNLHGVDFYYEEIPEKVPAYAHLLGRNTGQFDLVNLSGLLYHVYSPMHWIGSIRPLIRDGGLAIISTNVTLDPTHIMQFNQKGELQMNLTTYWYISVPLFDYMLRYFRLRPIRCEYMKNNGHEYYMSVICRAEEGVIADPDDGWMENSAFHSWDSIWYGGLDMTGKAEKSDIRFKDGKEIDERSGKTDRVDLLEFTRRNPAHLYTGNHEHTAVLRLDDIE